MRKHYSDLTTREQRILREYHSWVKSIKDTNNNPGAAWAYKWEMVKYYSKLITQNGLNEWIQ
jgi:hypothetical protein